MGRERQHGLRYAKVLGLLVVLTGCEAGTDLSTPLDGGALPLDGGGSHPAGDSGGDAGTLASDAGGGVDAAGESDAGAADGGRMVGMMEAHNEVRAAVGVTPALPALEWRDDSRPTPRPGPITLRARIALRAPHRGRASGQRLRGERLVLARALRCDAEHGAGGGGGVGGREGVLDVRHAERLWRDWHLEMRRGLLKEAAKRRLRSLHGHRLEAQHGARVRRGDVRVERRRLRYVGL